MVTTTKRGGHRARNSLARTVGALVACGIAVGLSGPSSAAGVPDEVVTIEELKDWALNGTDPKVMKGKIESSGTVYRMTPEAMTAMREDGVPSGIISYMQLIYTNAVQHEPTLATSDAKVATAGAAPSGHMLDMPKWISNAAVQ